MTAEYALKAVLDPRSSIRMSSARTVVDLDGVWLPVTHQLCGMCRDEQLRPELLGLRVCAHGELLS